LEDVLTTIKNVELMANTLAPDSTTGQARYIRETAGAILGLTIHKSEPENTKPTKTARTTTQRPATNTSSTFCAVAPPETRGIIPGLPVTHNPTTDPPPPYTKPTQSSRAAERHHTPNDSQGESQSDDTTEPSNTIRPHKHPPDPPLTNQRGLGNVIPADQTVIGANVHNTRARSTEIWCYQCRKHGFHQGSSCAASAARVIGAPFPGWTAEGVKIPSHWTSPTTISDACAQEWIRYLKTFNITGNPYANGNDPPDFAILHTRPRRVWKTPPNSDQTTSERC
jgi:hypothetical protein